MLSETSDDGVPYVTSPADYLGFRIGADRRLADWPQVVEYLNLVSDQSKRVETVEIGKTTEGNPFLLTYISSPDNIRELSENIHSAIKRRSYKSEERQKLAARMMPNLPTSRLVAESVEKAIKAPLN